MRPPDFVGGTMRTTSDIAARLDREPPMLTPSEVAGLFRVDPKTVTRWAKDGRLHAIRTLGGHRRYYEAEVRTMLSPHDTAASMEWERVSGQLGIED